MLNKISPLSLALLILFSGCGTGRDLTSPHYIPEWDNQVLNFPAPSETTGGMWALKSVNTFGKTLSRIMLIPPAIIGNVVINAYYMTTWPFRWAFRGDKRLIVWYPLFEVGDTVGSGEFSEEYYEEII